MTIYFEDVYETILNDVFGEKEGKKYQDVINPLGDSFTKDILMSALQPIHVAICGAMITAVSLIRVAFNILPALAGSSDSDLMGATAETLLGVGCLVLAAVTPLARLYNAFTRAYASVMGEENKMEVFRFFDDDTLSANDISEIRAGNRSVFDRCSEEFATRSVDDTRQEWGDTMKHDATTEHKAVLSGLRADDASVDDEEEDHNQRPSDTI